MLIGRRIIRWLRKMQIGESVRDLGLEGQVQKKGTPTMGGVIIIAAIVIPTLLFARLDNVYVVLLLISTLWMGAIGFLDDYIKVFKKDKEGLRGKFKILAQVVLGLVVGCVLYFHPSVKVRDFNTVFEYKMDSDGKVDLNNPTIEYSTAKAMYEGKGIVVGDKFLSHETRALKTNVPFIKNNLLYHNDELNTGPAPKDFYKSVDKIADKVAAGSDGLYFLPWLYGERSPVDDHHVRGGFYNMSLKHNRTHMLRSVLEGVSLNARWLLMYVEKMTGRPFEAVNFIGGGANSEVWSQITADVFNRPIKQMKDPLMSNSRGTAILALLAMGMMDMDEVSKVVEPKKVFEPDKANRAVYDEMFGRFVEIYNRNKPLYLKLNK